LSTRSALPQSYYRSQSDGWQKQSCVDRPAGASLRPEGTSLDQLCRTRKKTAALLPETPASRRGIRARDPRPPAAISLLTDLYQRYRPRPGPAPMQPPGVRRLPGFYQQPRTAPPPGRTSTPRAWPYQGWPGPCRLGLKLQPLDRGQALLSLWLANRPLIGPIPSGTWTGHRHWQQAGGLQEHQLGEPHGDGGRTGPIMTQPGPQFGDSRRRADGPSILAASWARGWVPGSLTRATATRQPQAGAAPQDLVTRAEPGGWSRPAIRTLRFKGEFVQKILFSFWVKTNNPTGTGLQSG